MVRLPILLYFAASSFAQCSSFSVPTARPDDATKLDSAPVGLSFEFFMWPSYMTNITPPLLCIEHFNELYERKMPIRIGGTTQDRATYDETLSAYVSYHVDDPLEAPMKLTYGPAFFDLIEEMGAETMLGLNRGLNDRTNTFSAALEAKSRVEEYIWAIELGNEPDLYWAYWQYPVAEEPWNEVQEGSDAADWAADFAKVWGEPLPILAGGGYAIPYPAEPAWPNLPYLVNEAYNQTVKDATKMYNGHLYTFSNTTEVDLAVEMSHTRTVTDLDFLPIHVAKAEGRPYVIGETGFHGQDDAMDATFGGAIQVVDKTLRALSMGVDRLYYHQGTINQAFFNWWLDDQINTPFYGGYFATLAASDANYIIAIDDGTDAYAQYVLYENEAPVKVVLVNTNYYSGNGPRSSAAFTMTGLSFTQVRALRMTAPSSETVTTLHQDDSSAEPSIGGRYFANTDCSISGDLEFEEFDIIQGKLTVNLAASEAIIIYL